MRARQRVREQAAAIGFDLVTQTKVVTAVSELARNTVVHGKGGSLDMTVVPSPHPAKGTFGLELVFTDSGPGIEDLELALSGGWSSGSGLGLGLSGSRRLVHEFDINSTPGGGTTVHVVMWGRPR